MVVIAWGITIVVLVAILYVLGRLLDKFQEFFDEWYRYFHSIPSARRSPTEDPAGFEKAVLAALDKAASKYAKP